MPVLRRVRRMVERDRADDQLAAQQPPRRRERHPPGHVDPPRDPRQDRHPLLPAYHRHPVVLAPRGRVRGEEFSQRGRQREIADARGDEAPDHGGGAARGEGEGKGGREGGPRVENGEGETQHGERGEVALQLLLVAQFGEVGGVVAGGRDDAGFSARGRHGGRLVRIWMSWGAVDEEERKRSRRI